MIGAQGSRIASIQDESGARVHIIRPQKEKGMREVLGSGRFFMAGVGTEVKCFS